MKIQNTTTKIIKLGFLLFLVVFLIIPKCKAESGSISTRLPADITKINEITKYLDNTQDTRDSILLKLGEYKTYYNQSSDFYSSESCKTGGSLDTLCDKGQTNATAMMSSLDLMAKSTTEEEFNNATNQYNQSVEDYNQTIKELNDTTGAGNSSDVGPLYVFLSIFFGIITIILYQKSRILPLGQARKIKKQVMTNLLKTSLWPTIGALVTTIWFYSTPPGSQYFILWGPMLIGFCYFISALSKYFKFRKELKKAIKEEDEYIKNVFGQGGYAESQEAHTETYHADGKLEECLRILDCKIDDSIDQIKTKYRKLVKDFHPDTLSSKKLPEELLEYSNNRFKDIQNAYEYIREYKGF